MFVDCPGPSHVRLHSASWLPESWLLFRFVFYSPPWSEANTLVRCRQVCFVVRCHRPGAERSSVNGRPFPSLIDVTTEELNIGLESGQFTSVDLVNVGSFGGPHATMGEY